MNPMITANIKTGIPQSRDGMGTGKSPGPADRNVCPTAIAVAVREGVLMEVPPTARPEGMVIALSHKPPIEASERLGLMKRFRGTVVMSDAEALGKLQQWLEDGRLPMAMRSDCEKAIAPLSVVAAERHRG